MLSFRAACSSSARFAGIAIVPMFSSTIVSVASVAAAVVQDPGTTLNVDVLRTSSTKGSFSTASD